MVAKHKSKNIGEFVSLVLHWQAEETDFSFGEWEKRNFEQVVECARKIFELLFGKCGLMSQPICEDIRLPSVVVEEKLEEIVECITELHREPPSTPRTRNLEQDLVIEEKDRQIEQLREQLALLSAEKEKKIKRKQKGKPPPPPPLPTTSPSTPDVDLSRNSDGEEGDGDGDNGKQGVGTPGGDGDNGGKGGGDGENDDEDGGISKKGRATVRRRLEEKLLFDSQDLFNEASADPENTDVVLVSNMVLPFKLLQAYSGVRALPSVPDDHDWKQISFVEAQMIKTLNDVHDDGEADELSNSLDETGLAVVEKFASHFNFVKKTFSDEEKETLIESLITLEKKLIILKSNKSKYFVLVHYPPPH
jgi:hypothetical protein